MLACMLMSRKKHGTAHANVSKVKHRALLGQREHLQRWNIFWARAGRAEGCAAARGAAGGRDERGSRNRARGAGRPCKGEVQRGQAELAATQSALQVTCRSSLMASASCTLQQGAMSAAVSSAQTCERLLLSSSMWLPLLRAHVRLGLTADCTTAAAGGAVPGGRGAGAAGAGAGGRARQLCSAAHVAAPRCRRRAAHDGQPALWRGAPDSPDRREALRCDALNASSEELG